jgi:glycosyltransferase involved in cell wall biosynthesis
MIAVIIPAHDEEDLVAACVASVQCCAASPELLGEVVRIIVVLDACTDSTAEVVAAMGAEGFKVNFCNVGQARAAGSDLALASGARWLAFTDADTVVAPDWLTAQLRQQADAVCGTVQVADWGHYGERMRQYFAGSYRDAEGHRHIHGANLGVSAEAYLRSGGFAPLRSSEDVALVEALVAQGARIAWTAAPRVVTSARREFRAPGGFGATLMRVAESAAP